MEIGLEEDRERNVEARSKDFQDRGGVKHLNTVQQDGEPDILETINYFHMVKAILSYLSYVARVLSRLAVLII